MSLHSNSATVSETPMVQIRQMCLEDLMQVNAIFVKAFSHARTEEGLKQHRVSPCRPEFLRMYLDRSEKGAIVALDRRLVVGFSFNHLFGRTGWIGPLAVMPKYQGVGIGKALVNHGVDHLTRCNANIIGLETMPRNFRNLGFYMRLGFNPGPLCVDMISYSHGGEEANRDNVGEVVSFREGGERDRRELLAGTGRVAAALSRGLDYTGEILLNMKHGYGDTMILLDGSEVVGFAVCHLEPYGQLEERRELKVNVLAMRPEGAASDSEGAGDAPSERTLSRLSALLAGVRSLAARERLSVVRLHVRVDKWHAVKALLSWGYKVAYSDLRMCVSGFVEREPSSHIHFCRWQ